MKQSQSNMGLLKRRIVSVGSANSVSSARKQNQDIINEMNQYPQEIINARNTASTLQIDCTAKFKQTLGDAQSSSRFGLLGGRPQPKGYSDGEEDGELLEKKQGLPVLNHDQYQFLLRQNWSSYEQLPQVSKQDTKQVQPLLQLPPSSEATHDIISSLQ